MKGMRTSSQKRRASAARKTLAALLLSAIMCFYGVPVAAIGESVANASNAGTLEQAGGSIQDSLTLDAGKSSGTLFSSTHGTEYYNWVSSDPSIAVADIVESGKMADDGSSYTVLYKYSITAGLKGGTTTVKLVNKASGVADAVYSVSVNPRTYVLTLDANGADAAAKTLKVTSGTTVSLSDYAVSRDGYTLVGWSANASADPTSAGVYKSTYEYTGVGNTTLYAIWSKNGATSPKAAENNQTDVQEPEDSAEYPAAELDSEADGVTVHVSAPAGALPEGVQLQTAAVYSGAVTYAIEQSANADGKEVSSLKAIDVTLTDKDGNEIQPNEKVVVTFGNTGVQGEQINVYHMDSEASAPEKIASNVSADPTVEAAHFSIYIVSGETTPAVATYQFLDAKGSVVSEQKVKDGETLYAPTSPEKSGAKFMGWTLTKGGATADFTPGSASVSKTETITVYPVFVGAHYVQFMDDQDRVAVTKTVGTGETVSTADVTLPLPSTKGVTGWYSSKEAAQAQDAGKLVTEYTFANDSDPDVVLWPHIEEGHYVTFDAHGGSYTKPQFVLNGKSASEPNDPTRMGYEFIGWSTSATEWSPYNFHSSVNDAVTLHAWWEAQETTYTVVIWKQSVNDSKNASDAEKTYDFAESHSEKATSGSKVRPSRPDTHKDYTGFSLNSNLTNSAVEVKGDGTTVVNVYYDRQPRTINFWEDKGDYDWLGFWHSDWQVVDTMTGLYGQSLAQNGYTWQSEIKWSTEKTDGDSYGFIGYFLDSNSEKNLYNVGEWEGNHSYQFYTENLDGSWPSIPNNYIPDSGRTRWTFDESEGYVGFTLSEYSKDSGRTWKECQIGQTITADMNSCDVWIRHTRNSYTLSFYNYNTTSKEELVKYEQPLSSFESYAPSRPEGLDSAYQFQGWYKDDALTEKFDFASETMPAAGLTLYARWAAPDQTATTHLSMAVSGSDTVSFDVAYGSKVDPAHMPTVKDSSGNVVSQGDDSLGVVTMPANTEWAGWATREDDCFVMFNFDSEIYSPIELYPYWISTDKYLVNYAANGGTGTVVDESSYDLSVQARVASGENLTAPLGKVFLGWSTSPDSMSAQYQPGDSITVSDLADASSRIATLYAVWGGTSATTSLTYRTNYPAETGLTDTSKESVANVENNYGGGQTGHAAGSLVTATPEELGFTVPDEYYFTGWSDGTKTIAAGESIGIDNLTANELTAQWCKKSELAITVKGTVDSKTYNGKEQSVSGHAATYALDGSVVTELPDGLTLSVSGDAASGTDVGTYETSMAGNVSISGNNAYKYKVTTSVSEGRLTIDKMAIENVGESASRTYTGSEIELTGITWATVAEGQSISGLTYSAKGTVAGTYDGAFSGEAKVVDASGADVTANYEITNTPGSLTIDRAEMLTVHAVGDSATYTYDGTEKSVEGYTTDAPADVTVELAAGKSARAAGTEAGTYQMGLTSADFSASSPNYESVAVEWADGSLTIDRAEGLALSAAGYEGVYDGVSHAVSATPSAAGTKIEWSTNGGATWAEDVPSAVDVVDLTIQVRATNPNYSNTATANTTLRIVPAELTVTTPSASKAFDGTALTKADGAMCEGLANGETASFEVTGSRTEIGTSDNTYELTWNGTAKQSNYRVTENLGKLTITDPAVEITKSLDNTGSGVDGTFLAGDNAQFTITVTNVGEDTLHNVAVTDSLLPDWSETVASLAPGAGNAATFSVSYEVTQADVDSGGLANIAYADPEGPADPVPTDPVPVPTDETASVSISKTLDNEGSSPDGAFVAGDVAEFTITVVNDGAVTLHNVAVTDSLLPDWSETVASLAPGAGNAATFSVSYEVTQADVDSGGLANIAYADPEGPADPVPTDPVPVPTPEYADITITANDASKLVGEEDPVLTATISGLPAGVEGITYTVSRVAGEDVGTYQIVPAGDEHQLGSDGTLYRISYVPGVFTITAPDAPTPPTPTPPTPTPPTPGTTVTVIPAPTTPTVTYIVAAPTPAAPADDGLVTVDENGTPTAPAEHVDCWVHWLIILGTLLASLYYIGVVIRRQKNINSLRAVAGKGKNV